MSSVIASIQKHISSPELNETNLTAIGKVMESEHLQQEFFKVDLPTLIEPLMVDIVSPDEQFVCKASYLPLPKLAAKYLSNKSILKKVIAENQNQPKCGMKRSYSDMMDGTCSSRLKGRLKIEFGLDDAEIAPACGFSGVQKYIFLYAACADLPYDQRVKTKDLEMVMSCNRKKLRQGFPGTDGEGLKAMLAPLAKDLNQLTTNGIDVRIGTKVINIKVTVASIIGDNLGLYELLGYGMSFQQSAFTCRFCAITSNTKSAINTNMPGTSHMLIENEATDSSGIVRPFALENQDINRHNCAPPDPAHDLMQGVIPEVLSFLLTWIVECRLMSKDNILKRFNDYRNSLFEGSPLIKAQGSEREGVHFEIKGSAIQVI